MIWERVREMERERERDRTKFYKEAVLGKIMKNTTRIHLRISSTSRKIPTIFETVFNTH